MQKNDFFSGLLILVLLLTGCSLPSSNTPGSPASNIPYAWFDAPLPGSLFYPPNPCMVVAHGSSPNGIALFELSVNGAAESIPSPDTENQIVTLTQECGLTDPGEYRLLLRVQDNAGAWSGYAETSLVISDESSTPTEPATEATVAPTEAVTGTPTATVSAALAFSAPELSSLQFYYRGGGCGVKQETFGITVLSGSPASVFLFYRLKNKANDETGAWSLGDAMHPSGAGAYSFILQADTVPGTLVPTGFVAIPVNYTLQYQFVATDSSGNVLGKSTVFGDLTLSYCDH